MKKYDFPTKGVSYDALNNWFNNLEPPAPENATMRDLYKYDFAEYYIIYAYDMQFDDVLQSIKQLKNSFVWIDLFCMNQHILQHHLRRYNWWGKAFLEQLEHFKEIAVIFPMEDFEPLLKSSWTAWELYSSVKVEKEISFLVPIDKEGDFERAMINHLPAIVYALEQYDIAATTAFDRRMHKRNLSALKTLEPVRKDCNEKIILSIKEFWSLQGMRFISERCLSDGIVVVSEDEIPNILSYLNALGYLFRDNKDMSIQVSSVAIEVALKHKGANVLPDRMFNLAREYNNLAVSLHDIQGESDDIYVAKDGKSAAECMGECVRLLNDARNQALGITPALMAKTTLFLSTASHNFANWLMEEKEYAAAVLNYKMSLDIKISIPPPERESVAETMNNLGMALYGLFGTKQNTEDKDELIEAAKVLRESLAIRVKIFGNSSAEAAQTHYNLAPVLDALGLENKAREQAKRAYDIGKVLYDEKEEVLLLYKNLLYDLSA
eukprot:maker-scaffold_1-snap-gene-8.8-mRNA-1 protein AED:0.04 eAED:0.11 QI:0/0/0.5/1/0/0/2/86/493